MPIETTNPSAARIPWAHFRLRPFPQIAVRVMQLANKDDAPLHILSSLIASDPAFASEVLTVANSPLFAPRTPAESVFQAVARMGTRNVQGLCLTVAVRSYLGKALSQPATRGLWRHNLACAVVAERLAAHASLDKDIAFTSGVMHDIGRLALSIIRPSEYSALLERHVGPAVSILDAERELFGADHCQAGKQLIAEWRLPPSFEGAVARHHEAGTTGGIAEMAGVISLSCRMADAAGYAAFEGCQPEPYAALLAEMPADERSLFPQTAEELAAQIHDRIHGVEAA
jgi:putative nucleotidyltransferase with HDIG domain